MNLRRLLLIAVLVAAGCGSEPSRPPSTDETARPAPGASTPSWSPPVQSSSRETVPPETLDEPMLSCGGDLGFPPAALQGPTEIGIEPDLAAVALRTFLSEPHEPDLFPNGGWMRVVERPDRVLFLAPGPSATPWVMVAVVLSRERSAAVVDAFGQCRLAIDLPDDVVAGAWWVDPEFGSPQPMDTSVHAVVRERACAGGHSPEGRLLEPVVLSGLRDITIIVPIRRRRGPNDCTGNPAIRTLIRLPAPLGSRALLDGATLPPRDANGPP